MKLTLPDSNNKANKSALDEIVDYYDNNFELVKNNRKKNKYYYKLKERFFLNKIKSKQKILEIGCWTGDLLDKLNPSFGIGVDLCEKAISEAKQKYRDKKFICGDFCSKEVKQEIGNITFDVILIVNVIEQVQDIDSFLENLKQVCTLRTRIYVYTSSDLCGENFIAAKPLSLHTKVPYKNPIHYEIFTEATNRFNFQEIFVIRQILFPFYIPILSGFINKYLAHLPFIENLCMDFCSIFRPLGENYKIKTSDAPSCTVVIPCRNESGNIPKLVNMLPDLGKNSEYIFVEGNSTDNTEEVVKSVIKSNADKKFRFIKQTGKGKRDAVRLGFANANGDILAILDADITVSPEYLPDCIQLLVENKAEFINCTRMLYPLQKDSMKPLNIFANKLFASIFTFILGCKITDTLCGTKILWKSDYKRIVSNRDYLGDFDPFGDFDLLFGAANLALKILDFPVKYNKRTYGETNISRFRDGWLLFKMSWVAYRKIKLI